MTHDNNNATCPYTSLPDHAFWRRAVESCEDNVDPIVAPKFKIGKSDKVATAGSCFAQHVSRYMQLYGANYFVAEEAHPLLTPELVTRFNYGVYSARYGNIYTQRQLLQLIQRAYGAFTPKDGVWRDKYRYVDPFRPFIQPRGFASKSEFVADRDQHFAAVRAMFETLDVFVFTLGLTECWRSTEDGAVYPVCPGCGAGEHDAARHEFINYNYTNAADDMRAFLAELRRVNAGAKVLLTVSPVPLIATNSRLHVLPATVYSKSVLRTVAGDIAAEHDFVDYFPSYEIVTGSHTRGAYFEPDLRSVTETGVRKVMQCLFRNYFDLELEDGSTIPNASVRAVNESTRISRLVCDEENLDADAVQNSFS
ncbi:MAG: GSCFA domain-containing protein [Hyphomicrobiales bacterium]|nr:GSCFA domain-containing protein [Hyphomicrobiales bacterium]